MNKQSLHVLIVGAGTGGLCLAHGLKQAGVRVSVFERDRTRRDGLQGYRVGISPRGCQSLQACLPPALFELFLATCARGPRYFNILTEHMNEVLSMPVIASADIAKNEQSVSRMTLRQVLLTGLEDVVSFDKRFSRYQHNEDGSVTAFFEDGSHSTGDVLVGADGAGSRLRKQRLPHARLEETGIVSIGGKLPLTAESRALISDKMNEGVTLVLAPKGYGGIVHVMEFKWNRHGVKEGVGGNDAALIADWPGLLYDNTADYIMWGVWGARQNLPADPTNLEAADLVRFASDMTRDWHPNIRKLIERTDPTTTFAINIRTSVPLSSWQSSNVTLLGDAIHTMTPGRGVGANTALRDAALLAKKLTEVRDGHEDPIKAIHEYETEMLGYSMEAVLASRKQMDARDAIHKPVLGSVLLACMRAFMRLTNLVPQLKLRMAQKEMRLRAAE
jgi:2-polyprenyl-6-methoxyphenol hydroxylase-like FAD-dependent oxidoreductase